VVTDGDGGGVTGAGVFVDAAPPPDDEDAGVGAEVAPPPVGDDTDGNGGGMTLPPLPFLLLDGVGTAVTVTVTLPVILPPLPVQVIV